MMKHGMTLAELMAMPVIVDIGTASRALGLGRSTGYELARRGEFRAVCCMSAVLTACQRPSCCASWALMSVSCAWAFRPHRAR